jgi:PRC-barrel domain
MIDDLERKVRFIEVASGGFLGIGETKFLIPVDAITKITDDAIYINRTREYIAGAPRYNPDLVDERYLGDVNKYYENPTEWGPDPPYPSPRL